MLPLPLAMSRSGFLIKSHIRNINQNFAKKKLHFLYTNRQNRCFKALSTQRTYKHTAKTKSPLKSNKNLIENQNKKTCEKKSRRKTKETLIGEEDKNKRVGCKGVLYIRKNRYIEDNCDFLSAYIKPIFVPYYPIHESIFFLPSLLCKLLIINIFCAKNLHMCEKSSTFAYDFKRGCTSDGVG